MSEKEPRDSLGRSQPELVLELGRLSAALVQAISDGALALVRDQVVRLQKTWDRLDRLEEAPVRPSDGPWHREAVRARLVALHELLKDSQADDPVVNALSPEAERLLAVDAAWDEIDRAEACWKENLSTLSEAEQLLHPRFVPNRDVIVLIGSSATSLAGDLAARGATRVICYGDGSGADVAAGVAHVETRASLMALIRNYGHPIPRRVQSRCAPWIDEELHADISAAAQDALVAARVNQNTLDSLGPGLVENALRNARHVAQRPSISVLHDLFHGIPAILVAPGPSLSKNISQLAAAQDSLVIIAGSRALRALSRAGVKPHLVLVVDPQPQLAFHFDGVRPSDFGALVLGTSVAPDLFDVDAHQIFTCAGSKEIDAWLLDRLGEAALLPTGGSVSTAAFSLALHLGCRSLALIGHDLALTNDQLYAEGSTDGGATLAFEGDTFWLSAIPDLDAARTRRGIATPDIKTDQSLWVRSVDGGRVRTTPRFVLTRNWFEFQAQQLKGARFINATEGGAYVEGWAHCSLSDALLQMSASSESVAKRLAQIAPPGTAREQEALSVARRMLSDLARAEELCAKCDELARDSTRRTSLVAAIDDLRAVMDRIGFLHLYQYRDYRSVGSLLDHLDGLNDTLHASRDLFVTLRSAATRLKTLLVDAWPSTAGENV